MAFCCIWQKSWLGERRDTVGVSKSATCHQKRTPWLTACPANSTPLQSHGRPGSSAAPGSVRPLVFDLCGSFEIEHMSEGAKWSSFKFMTSLIDSSEGVLIWRSLDASCTSAWSGAGSRHLMLGRGLPPLAARPRRSRVARQCGRHVWPRAPDACEVKIPPSLPGRVGAQGCKGRHEMYERTTQRRGGNSDRSFPIWEASVCRSRPPSPLRHLWRLNSRLNEVFAHCAQGLFSPHQVWAACLAARP